MYCLTIRFCHNTILRNMKPKKILNNYTLVWKPSSMLWHNRHTLTKKNPFTCTTMENFNFSKDEINGTKQVGICIKHIVGTNTTRSQFPTRTQNKQNPDAKKRNLLKQVCWQFWWRSRWWWQWERRQSKGEEVAIVTEKDTFAGAHFPILFVICFF